MSYAGARFGMVDQVIPCPIQIGALLTVSEMRQVCHDSPFHGKHQVLGCIFAGRVLLQAIQE